MRKLFLSTFCFFVALAGISSAEELEKKTEYGYFTDGMYYYADKSYKASAEQFEALTHRYPYSEYAHDALIMEMYNYYIDGSKEKVAGVASVFHRLFPLDKETPYVLYLQAMADYTSLKDETRMLDVMEESERTFQKIVDEYPDSSYASEAKKKLNYLNGIRQLNYLHSGEFYQNRGDYIGAMRRYTGIFETFGDKLLPEIEERTLCRLVYLSKAMRNKEDSEKYRGVLVAKFPKNKCF